MKHFQEQKDFYIALTLSLITLILFESYISFNIKIMSSVCVVFCCNIFILIGMIPDLTDTKFFKRISFYTLGPVTVVMASFTVFVGAYSMGIFLGTFLFVIIQGMLAFLHDGIYTKDKNPSKLTTPNTFTKTGSCS